MLDSRLTCELWELERYFNAIGTSFQWCDYDDALITKLAEEAKGMCIVIVPHSHCVRHFQDALQTFGFRRGADAYELVSRRGFLFKDKTTLRFKVASPGFSFLRGIRPDYIFVSRAG